ncbi:RAMP superfamily CRISPR-associated protein [Photobacterium aphoticum]|uniref:CRISPR type III-associated protein domain-containing protein n=1 Tax=Photobacterium aphoticum TaxID=754436 RepID=A0A0J1GIJ2_9GAMM|nr:RAMP superfamily CRISPR-associated protein [Photobacterium aphoticum]KLU99509.1 hypothetical protein ABT58_16790 [Photobacterium aphoticum]GHA52875.1 hypothetical protein GCM10007086_28880 [Photobacterium aphoticum]
MEETYYHLTLEATLTPLTPLSIGNGERVTKDSEIKPENHHSEALHRITENEMALCQDKDQRFYIPGSSLKGSVRNAARCFDTPEAHTQWIFGDKASLQENQTQTQTQTQTSVGGNVRFLNAYCRLDNKTDSLTHTRTRNRIDPVTGTAKDAHLFDHNGIKPGTPFTFTVHIEQATQQQLTALITLLQRWGNAHFTLGRGGNNQFGAFSLCMDNLYGITQAHYMQWLSAQSAAPLSDYVHALPIKTEDCTPANSGYTRVAITLTPLSPLFIGSGQTAEHSEEKEGKAQSYHVATLLRNTQGEIILPATSLRGVMRHQGQKILNTLNHFFADSDGQRHAHTAEQKATALLSRLFGDEQHASTIKLTDFVAQQPQLTEQRFIAIDRFTGGVKDGALYSVEKCLITDYKGELLIDNRLFSRQYHSELAMLLLILRDLLDGELLLGGLKNKGFGKTTAHIQITDSVLAADCPHITHWGQFIAYWNQASLPNLGELMDAFNLAFVAQQEHVS